MGTAVRPRAVSNARDVGRWTFDSRRNDGNALQAVKWEGTKFLSCKTGSERSSPVSGLLHVHASLYYVFFCFFAGFGGFQRMIRLFPYDFQCLVVILMEEFGAKDLEVFVFVFQVGLLVPFKL